MRKLLSALVIVAALVGAISLFAPSGTWHKISLSTPVAEAQAAPDVTLGDTLYWDAVGAAAGYQVRILTSANGPHWPDNTNANIVHDNGLDTFFPVATGLTGSPVANYKLQVRAVEAGGANPTPWSSLTVNYIGLEQPQNLRLTP